MAERKKAFETATDTYLTTLQKVDVGLKRQIWGLEEADIIIEKKARETQELQSGPGAKPEKDLEGGTGKLDIGWLNSRSGKVGRDNEAELWAKAGKFLESLGDKEGSDEKENGNQNTRS